jgi:hypothetical protein
MSGVFYARCVRFVRSLPQQRDWHLQSWFTFGDSTAPDDLETITLGKRGGYSARWAPLPIEIFVSSAAFGT